jgi:hypothetical protein
VAVALQFRHHGFFVVKILHASVTHKFRDVQGRVFPLQPVNGAEKKSVVCEV